MDSMEIFQLNPLNPSAENVPINKRRTRASKMYNTRKTDAFYKNVLFLYASEPVTCTTQKKKTYV